MIAEGVFEEFSELKVVWADGAADMVTPFIWRMDTFGLRHLEQTPWAPEMPSSYLPDHVYFVHSRMDGPGQAPFADEWLKDDRQGGHAPVRFQLPRLAARHPPATCPRPGRPGSGPKCWAGNAARLYRLGTSVPAPVTASTG